MCIWDDPEGKSLAHLFNCPDDAQITNKEI